MNRKLPVLVLGIIGVAIILGAIILAKASPSEVLLKMLTGSFGKPSSINGTLREMAPFLTLGAGVFIALKAGLFNIGIEGQMVVGACTAAGIGTRIPGIGGVLLGIAGGMLAGAFWAFPAGWIKAYRNGHEVITTIMLNNVAKYVTDWLVAGPLKGPNEQSPTTAVLPLESRIPSPIKISGIDLNPAIIIGILTCVILWRWLRTTVAGYELRATGANPTAAQFAGVDAKRIITSAMVQSGALGGLTGALLVFGFEGRFYEGFYAGYGFDSLGVALLSGASALGIIPSALFFGALYKGGVAVASLGVKKGIVAVILGVVILVTAAARYSKQEASHG